MKGLIPIFNVAEAVPEWSSNIQPGVICLANESRLQSRHYSEPLTSYITGWRDPNNIQDTLDFLAPPVQVARRFEFKKSNNAEEFLSETDDLRAINSSFKRVEYTGTTTTSKTLNKGLSIRIDQDEMSEMPGLREQAVRRLTQRILRNELRRAIAAAVAAASNNAKTWDTTAGKDPDMDILNDLNDGTDATGIRANRILFGEVSWTKRAIAHRAQNTAGGFASAMFTPTELATMLGVTDIRISRERYQNAAATKAKVVGDIVLSFYAQNDPGIDDPSHLKRFWTPCESGGQFRVFEEQQGPKFLDITVEHYSNVVATSTAGIRTLTIS